MSDDITLEKARELIEKAKNFKKTTVIKDERLNGTKGIAKELDDKVKKINVDVLKHLRFGIHTKAEFEFLGSPITLRLLSNREERGIKEELIKQGLIAGTNGIYEYENMCLRLAKAGTSYPDTDDAILNYESWNQIPTQFIEEMFKEYCAFCINCNLKLDDIYDEDILLEVLADLEKKPHLLNELPYRLHRKIASIYQERYMTLMLPMGNSPTE